MSRNQKWVLALVVIIVIGSMVALLFAHMRASLAFFGHGFEEPKWISKVMPIGIAAAVSVSIMASAFMALVMVATPSKGYGLQNLLMGFFWFFINIAQAWGASLYAYAGIKKQEDPDFSLIDAASMEGLNQNPILISTLFSILVAFEMISSGAVMAGARLMTSMSTKVREGDRSIVDLPDKSDPSTHNAEKLIDRVQDYIQKHNGIMTRGTMEDERREGGHFEGVKKGALASQITRLITGSVVREDEYDSTLKIDE